MSEAMDIINKWNHTQGKGKWEDAGEEVEKRTEERKFDGIERRRTFFHFAPFFITWLGYLFGLILMMC